MKVACSSIPRCSRSTAPRSRQIYDVWMDQTAYHKYPLFSRMPIAYIARLIYFIMIGNSWVEAIYSMETIDLGLS